MDHFSDQTGNQNTPWDKWKWKHHIPKYVGCCKSSSKKEVYSNIDLHQETRKISNIQSDLILKGIEKKKPKINRRKEIMKIRVEINDKDWNIPGKSNETQSWSFGKIKLINF